MTSDGTPPSIPMEIEKEFMKRDVKLLFISFALLKLWNHLTSSWVSYLLTVLAWVVLFSAIKLQIKIALWDFFPNRNINIGKRA